MPLYGTWIILMPACELKLSIARWTALPSPDEPYVTAPGFAFAIATNSASVFAGTWLPTRNSTGCVPISVTCVKSRSGS